MKWMIRGALVMTDAASPAETLDLVIENDRIVEFGRSLDLAQQGVSQVQCGRGKLIVPGLVNAHLHSHDRFDKGRFGTLPLEIWISQYNPPTISREWTPRDCYLRTMLSGFDLLRSGTTMVIDDVHHGLPASHENIDAVFQAYDDLGIRAQVSVAHCDKPFWDGVPYLSELLPASLKLRRDQFTAPSCGWMLDYWRDMAETWNSRVEFVLSPSGPQRCSDAFLQDTWNLSERYDLPVVIHVLETRIQQMSGQYYYGKSIVAHMAELGILTPRSNLVHGVWMTDDDLELVAEHGSPVVHCPGSNLKLGSGIAPVSRMLAAGIPVGIGTDNHNANDNASMLETIKAAGLVSAVREEDYQSWLSARDVLRMATEGGATCAGRQHQFGTLAPGKKADFVVFDLASPAFTPLNDIANQLVYSEQGEGIDQVFVDGRAVFEKGQATLVDEFDILSEVREKSDYILSRIESTISTGEALRPYLEAAYKRCRSA